MSAGSAHRDEPRRQRFYAQHHPAMGDTDEEWEAFNDWFVEQIVALRGEGDPDSDSGRPEPHADQDVSHSRGWDHRIEVP